jgi:maleate isomerase
MAENPRHYTVGWISPTDRPEGRETQLDDKLPSNIRTISLSLNFTRGTEEEFGAAIPAYESKVAELAAAKADLIIPGGAPPFMLLGFHGERKIIRSWEKKYGIPMFTSGQNHIRALKTLNLHKFVGASYFPQKLNAVFERYFTEAGFRVLEMEGIHVPFADVPKLQGAEIFDHIKRIFDKHRDAEGVYMLGSAWKTLDIIEKLEQALSVPVVHPGPARCWETQIRLGFRQPVPGYGRLLAQMPEAATLE